jgi:hypothetical protein
MDRRWSLKLLRVYHLCALCVAIYRILRWIYIAIWRCRGIIGRRGVGEA